jgi:hypothetical protein
LTGIRANASLSPCWGGVRCFITRKLTPPNFRRTLAPANIKLYFTVRHSEHDLNGFSIKEIFNLTKIDRWFLVQIKEIVDFEEELAGAKN